MRESIIEVKNLTKKFGDFVANCNINLNIKEGEIRAIIGENGAGKSTLMNMLYGIYQPTAGDILFRGKKVIIDSPRIAIDLGIGMIHQHFKLSSSLTVYENIVLGTEILKKYDINGNIFNGFLVDNKKEKEDVQLLVDKLNFNLDINAKVGDISIGAKQRVEILKMLYRDVDILILDEPTAVLIPDEVLDLIERLKSLKNAGKTIIIITHKLNEVKMCADNITVIRAGKVIGTVPNTDKTTDENLAEMMVGRPVLLRVRKSGKPSGKKIAYNVSNLTAIDSEGKKIFNEINIKVHEKQIIGIAGVEGNGQTELMQALTGLLDVKSGKVEINGKDVTGMWPDELREYSVGIIPEDRYRQGLCLKLPVSANLIAGYHGKRPYCKYGIMNRKIIKENKNKLVSQYDIRLSTGDPAVGSLSGGNAQKVIIAREFSRAPKVLLVSQPTRGVDIGAIEFIHNAILKMRDEGCAVLVISSELSEITGLSDRILVMCHGEITGNFKATTVSFNELGMYMSGVKKMTKEELENCD
ncbi:ABC transporter ATP-binding protein [Treponema parvum]|uniref:ABC transporter ATP-binding protein n=1 Tax=Treponema parvum TaxID=138851 RepID=A0A975F1Q6_9SPIR|nr:ABC transporter ATP-binding protein [Treponema parvum]QTQ12986.1 ABC transporter ATP-binding protein [Treponema parvum]